MLKTSTILFMFIIVGITWGTLAFLLIKAYHKEKKKNKSQNG
jgi:hypothetical protein